MLVLVAAGGGVLHGEGQISLAAAVVAPGLMVMGIILFMGAVSGAHLNPVVSLAFALRGDFPWKRVLKTVEQPKLGASLSYKVTHITHADWGFPGYGPTVLQVQVSAEVLDFQAKLVTAVSPYVESGGTAAAFVTDLARRSAQPSSTGSSTCLLRSARATTFPTSRSA
jgi:hypothetical protein